MSRSPGFQERDSSRRRLRSDDDFPIPTRRAERRRTRSGRDTPDPYYMDESGYTHYVQRDDDQDTRHRSRSVSRDRSPRQTFRRAVDNEGNDLTIDVALQSAEGTAGFLPTQKIPYQTTLSKLQMDGELDRRYHCESIQQMDVINAHRYSKDGEESAVLRYKKSSTKSQDHQFRWM